MTPHGTFHLSFDRLTEVVPFFIGNKMQQDVLSICSGLEKNELCFCVKPDLQAACCNPSSSTSLPYLLLNGDNWLLLEGSEEKNKYITGFVQKDQRGKNVKEK